MATPGCCEQLAPERLRFMARQHLHDMVRIMLDRDKP
jgi:hypothetical protein